MREDRNYIRITEHNLRDIITECVERVISEATLSDKIQGAISARKHGRSLGQGFKYGKKALADSDDAVQVSHRLLQDLAAAFKSRYSKDSTALSQMYQVHKAVADALNLDWDGHVMLGNIYGIWTFPLEKFEGTPRLKDPDSVDNQTFRDNWGVPPEKDYVTIYSEICAQYRGMIKYLIQKLQDKIISNDA